MSSQMMEVVIKEQVKVLKLPAIGREYLSLARRVQDGGWSYEEFLRELLDEEIQARQARTAARRLREAHFPDVKTLDQIDWDAMSGVSRQKTW